MLRVNDSTKVYVFCPHDKDTGGGESLHQLFFRLNEMGIESYIYYYDKTNQEKIEISPKLKKYNVKLADSISDIESNIIIIPEIATEYIYKYKNVQKCIWWLSLDNYFKSNPKNIAKNNKYIKKIKNIYVKSILTSMVEFRYKLITKRYKVLDFVKDKSIHKYKHIYNCEYVKMYLLKQGILEENMKYLCGPIDKNYIISNNIIKEKCNIVVYNPAKDTVFSKKVENYVSKRRSDILFIPIRDMNTEQVKTLLIKSKVYMDFGYFPGPERLPREAVVSFCNIITSNKGSASNEKDVLVPQQYKFNVENNIIEDIYEALIELIDNYENNIYLYDSYRLKVEQQIYGFNEYINQIFKKSII